MGTCRQAGSTAILVHITCILHNTTHLFSNSFHHLSTHPCLAPLLPFDILHVHMGMHVHMLVYWPTSIAQLQFVMVASRIIPCVYMYVYVCVCVLEMYKCLTSYLSIIYLCKIAFAMDSFNTDVSNVSTVGRKLAYLHNFFANIFSPPQLLYIQLKILYLYMFDRVQDLAFNLANGLTINHLSFPLLPFIAHTWLSFDYISQGCMSYHSEHSALVLVQTRK